MRNAAYISVIAALCAPAALAERIECTFAAPCLQTICTVQKLPLTFEIDLGQFAPPLHANEPPRNKVTTVALGEWSFPAESIVMEDGTRGFWANVDGVEHLMTTRPDGLASYATTAAPGFMTGTCEVFR